MNNIIYLKTIEDKMKKIILVASVLGGIILGTTPVIAADTGSMTKHTEAMEITKSAAKMKVEEMKGHMKIGSISGTAQSTDDLENKLGKSAAMMGAKYYVITSLTNDNHAYGTADLYN